MVSPMREKRTWPPQDKDSDGETVAAFEAAVAVVKETVVRSGEVLVSAKEDLSDHQRWLKAQTAKVAADRQRDDRFLVRQRERQEALLRREQTRARRKARRQAAAHSIKEAVSATTYAVRSAVGLVAAKTIANLNYLDALAAYGLRWLWAWTRHVTLYAAGAAGHGAGAAGLVAAKTIAGLNYLDALAAYGLRWLWAWTRHVTLYAAGAAGHGAGAAGRTVRSLAVSVWSLLSSLGAAIGAKVHAAAPSVTNFLSLYFGGIAARTRDVSRAIGRGVGPALSRVSTKVDSLSRQAGEALGPAASALAARAHALAPSLTEWVQSLLAPARPPAVAAETAGTAVDGGNAVSSPRAVGRFDLSQMLIIAGALLLVCGGLMLGGGFMLRAKTPTPLVAASASEPIAWLFEHPSLPIDERSVFVFDAAPDGLRIKGFAIGGVNLSEETVGSLGGVIKPDGRDQNLDLALSVEPPGVDTDEAQQPQPPAALPEGAVPSQAPFRLVYLFPTDGADGGLTSQQVLSTYGGVLLKVHYEMEGKQRSFIQYLPAALLEEQLAEILASAKGS
jgi:hypothetical protein